MEVKKVALKLKILKSSHDYLRYYKSKAKKPYAEEKKLKIQERKNDLKQMLLKMKLQDVQ